MDRNSSDAASSSAADLRPTRIGALTGLRFFAAVAVFLFHFVNGFALRVDAPMPIRIAFLHGYHGVSLFFMLSGFILTYTYADRVGRTGWLADFFIARFARIYPVYLAALIIGLPHVLRDIALADALKVVFMIQAWGVPGSDDGYRWVSPAWTLSAEFAFYLSFPLLITWLARVPHAGLWLLLVAGWGAMVAFGIPSIAPGTQEIATLPALALVPLPIIRLVEFVVGMVLCLLLRAEPRHAMRIAGPVPTLMVIGAILAGLSFDVDVRLLALAMVVSGILLVQLAAGDNWITRLLSSPPLLLLGGASYALYMLQMPIRDWLAYVGAPRIEGFVNPFVAIGLAILVFLYWEEPLRRRILRAAGRR